MNNYIVDDWMKVCKRNDRINFLKNINLDCRVWSLFSIACGREIIRSPIDEQVKEFIEVIELYVDGLTSRIEIEKIHSPNMVVFWSVHCSKTTSPSIASAYAAHAATWADTSDFHLQKRQGIILAQMCPTPFDDNWINPTTTSLARQIYDKKDFSLMPILADALQDVDCNEEILNHLRSPGPFYKGNYIIDRLIGKRS